MQQTTIPSLILRHVGERPGRVLTLVALALALAASAVVPPLIVAHVVDRAIGGTIDAWAAAIAAAGVAALAAWDGVLTLARRRLAVENQIAARAAAAKDHFGFCLRLPMSEFRDGGHAVLIRSFDDLDSVVEVVAKISAEFFANATIVASYAVLMLAVEPKLALVFFVLAGLGLITSIGLANLSRIACEAWLPRRDDRFAHIVDCLTSMLTIKTLNAHALAARPFAAEQAAEDAAYRTYQRRLAMADAAGRFFSVATPSVVAVAGAVMLIAGGITAGTLVLFLSVSAGVVAALTALHFELQQLQQAGAALSRMHAVTASEPEQLDENPQDLPTIASGAVEAEDLKFRHRGANAATLAGLSLKIRPGEHVAIVARSGEGKTTLAYLLARLHEPDGGTVFAAGVPAAAMPLARWRSGVVLMSHAVQVFGASVRDNVRLWDDSVSDAKVREALALAELAATVDGFADGLDTKLGERGNPLSAGQRQRLGLARIFLRAPEVLILDEATSALDAETERLVLDNVRRLMRGRILIVITHRLEVAARLDRIIRMAGGRVVDGGEADAGFSRAVG